LGGGEVRADRKDGWFLLPVMNLFLKLHVDCVSYSGVYAQKVYCSQHYPLVLHVQIQHYFCLNVEIHIYKDILLYSL
jgi:hypothetical protein